MLTKNKDSRVAMSRGIRTLCVALAVFLLSLQAAFSCSLAPQEYAAFDAKEYVFYGKVVGYTSMANYDCGVFAIFCRSWGWKMEVVAPVSMPQRDRKIIEVYSFLIGADCSHSGRKYSDVTQIPIGKLFMVAAASGSASGEVPQLNLSRSLEPIFMPLEAGEDARRLAQEEYGYGPPSADREIQRRMPFELRKDMARLEADTSPAARRRVLVRLARAWWFRLSPPTEQDWDAPFQQAVRRYIDDPAVVRDLMRERKAFLHAKL